MLDDFLYFSYFEASIQFKSNESFNVIKLNHHKLDLMN